jgi:hypothetical protein
MSSSDKARLQSIFDQYVGKEVVVEEKKMLGHSFYELDEKSSPLKELKEEAEKAGFTFRALRHEPYSAIETPVQEDDNRVTVVTGVRGLNSPEVILNIGFR